MLHVSFITILKSNLRTVLTTENTTENNCVIVHAQNRLQSDQRIFNWNTIVSGQKLRMVDFPQPKPLPRSNTYSTALSLLCAVSISQKLYWFYNQKNFITYLLCTVSPGVTYSIHSEGYNVNSKPYKLNNA